MDLCDILEYFMNQLQVDCDVEDHITQAGEKKHNGLLDLNIKLTNKADFNLVFNDILILVKPHDNVATFPDGSCNAKYLDSVNSLSVGEYSVMTCQLRDIRAKGNELSIKSKQSICKDIAQITVVPNKHFTHIGARAFSPFKSVKASPSIY